jgi:hypothetical protein
MAENYQMIELTPETEYQMLLSHKSIAKNDSSYSCQYADPMEMVSPRLLTENQVNYYGTMETQSVQMQSQLDIDQSEDDLSQLMENRPYDFELSSHSKYKIVSENQQVKRVLTSESAQPSKNVTSLVAKKLTFGYEQPKKTLHQTYVSVLNKQQPQSQSNMGTMILSGGEQTINFNLTQEEEEQKS